MLKNLLALLIFWLSLFCEAAVAQTCVGFGTRNITVEDCLASADPVAASLTISPNPAVDFLFVKNGGEAQYFELFDLFGRKVLALTLAAETSMRVAISQLPAGMYIATWRAAPFQKAAFVRVEICRG